MNNELSFIPLGGSGDVTKNMYVYEYQNQILIVDCGIGFADETMVGVDLLLPDITYLLQSKKPIVGMLLTHGHEDHIGALPFILPQLPQFPIFGSPFTAALANEKLREFGIGPRVKTVTFDGGAISLGLFQAKFIHVTHSVPDTAHIFLKTPVGNFYHGSDYKFDDTPADGLVSDYSSIKSAGEQKVLCMMSDCLGSEKAGRTPTEKTIEESFRKEIPKCKGKFIVTTYSSNIARLNQIVTVSKEAGRKVCFIGRSLIKTKDVAKKLGYMQFGSELEVQLDQLKNYQDHQLTLIVAGSQGQESSAMFRIANNEHREVKLKQNDMVIFSADPIPGNELSVYEVIDTLAKQGIRVLYTPLSRAFHVSGHGAVDEIIQLVDLVKPKKLIPIGGNYRHMAAYKFLLQEQGYKKEDVFSLDDGQEVIFNRNGTARLGKVLPIKNVYMDEVSGEEVEHFVLRDRQKLSEGGIAIVMAEVDGMTGQLLGRPDIIARGFPSDEEVKQLNNKLVQDLRKVLGKKKGKVINWVYIRKLVGETAERRIYRDLRRSPLVLPVILEV